MGLGVKRGGIFQSQTSEPSGREASSVSAAPEKKSDEKNCHLVQHFGARVGVVNGAPIWLAGRLMSGKPGGELLIFPSGSPRRASRGKVLWSLQFR